MIEWTTLANFIMAVAGFVLASLGLILSVVYRPMERWMRRYFIVHYSVMIVCTTALIIDYYAHIAHLPSLIKPMISVESLMSSLLMPLLTIFLLRLCGESWRRSPLFIGIVGLWAAYLALLVYTQFTTAIYSVSPDGVYSLGKLYPLLLMPLTAIMLLNLIGVFLRWKKLSIKQRRALLIYLTVPLAATILHMFFSGLLVIYFGLIVGAFAMSVFILSDQVDIAVRQEKERAESEFNLKVLQMRPHFIYNVMTSIYYLVDTNPQAAKNAILSFSKYLHQNFSAVVKNECIPFEDELKHTQAYLAIEKMRFGDRLDVTYDMRDTIFRLPPLTLEPIVENAVKHGMNPDCDPLHILIQTRAVEGGHEITVINSGAEFKQIESAGDGVGLNNVRERLKLMCGGSLRIIPAEGGGTSVTISIPKK